jgi:hypothetical protein
MNDTHRGIFAHSLRTLDESQIETVTGGKGNFSQDAAAKAMDSNISRV